MPQKRAGRVHRHRRSAMKRREAHHAAHNAEPAKGSTSKATGGPVKRPKPR